MHDYPKSETKKPEKPKKKPTEEQKQNKAYHKRMRELRETECLCSFRQRMVGDGCYICNPTYDEDHRYEGLD